MRLFLIGIFIILINFSKGQQVSDDLYMRYNPTIAAKTIQFSSLLNLDAKYQLLLAADYKWQDSLVLEYTKKVKDIRLIQRYNDSLGWMVEYRLKEKLALPLRSVLDSMQNKWHAPPMVDNILVYNIDRNSILAYVLRVRNYLKLNKMQIDTIIQFGTKASTLFNANRIVNTLSKDIQFRFLSKVLDRNQFFNFYDYQASSYVENTIKETQNTANGLGIIAMEKNTKSISSSIRDYYKHKLDAESWGYYNKMIHDSLMVDYVKYYPPILTAINFVQKGIPIKIINTKFNAISNAELYWQFGTALKLSDSLALSDSQIDSIIYYESILKTKTLLSKSDPDSFYLDRQAFESKYLSFILTERQYRKVSNKRNEDQALNSARKDWAELRDRGLASNFDKIRTLKELKGYYLNKYYIYDRYAHLLIERDRRNRFADLHQPVVLSFLKESRKANVDSAKTTGW